MNRESLPFKKRGDRISSDEWNALVSALRINPNSYDTYVDGGADVSVLKPKSQARYFPVFSSVEILPYSCFGIGAGQGSSSSSSSGSGVTYIQAIQFGASGGSPLAICTNDSMRIPSGGWGYARAINAWDTAILNVNGNLPETGHFCGPKPNTFDIEVGRLGLVMLSLGLDANTVRVIRTPDPVSILGIVTSEVSAFNSSTDTLGSGIVKVLSRFSGSTIEDAVDPSTGDSPWLVNVLNAHENTYAVDSIISANNVLGVGLTIVSISDGGGGSASTEATRITCFANGAFTAGDSTFSVDGVAGINGTTPSVSTVSNTHGWQGDDDALVRAEYNETSDDWEAYQVSCTA